MVLLLTGQVLGPSSFLFSHTDWAAQEPDLAVSCRKKMREMSNSDSVVLTLH